MRKTRVLNFILSFLLISLVLSASFPVHAEDESPVYMQDADIIEDISASGEEPAPEEPTPVEEPAPEPKPAVRWNKVTVKYASPNKTKARVTIVRPGANERNAAAVRIAVWSSRHGQDDLVRYNASKKSSVRWSTVINSARHNCKGKYYIRVFGKVGGTWKKLAATTVTLKRVDLPLKKQLAGLNKLKGGSKVRTYQGARIPAAKKKKLNKAIRRIRKKGKTCSFVVMNLQSGKMISYNAKASFFGASTVKGPYTIAVCRSDKTAWDQNSAEIRKIIIKSDNGAYTRFRSHYGNGPMKSLYRLAGRSDTSWSQTWPDTNAAGLARLWCAGYIYLKRTGTDADSLRPLFKHILRSPIDRTLKCRTYNKSGWMFISDGRTNLNDAGIVMSENGPYVIAVLTTLEGHDFAPANDLVRILNQIQITM